MGAEQLWSNGQSRSLRSADRLRAQEILGKWRDSSGKILFVHSFCPAQRRPVAGFCNNAHRKKNSEQRVPYQQALMPNRLQLCLRNRTKKPLNPHNHASQRSPLGHTTHRPKWRCWTKSARSLRKLLIRNAPRLKQSPRLDRITHHRCLKSQRQSGRIIRRPNHQKPWP